MYDKNIVKLTIGKVETSIDFKLGVKKRDSMAPVLFLDGPGTKEILIRTQEQLIKIHRTISESPTQHLLICNDI